MTRDYTIVRQTTVPAGIDECWQFLVQSELVGEWFADVTGSLAPGSAFEFHFGDGDFFRGSIDAIEIPVSIRFWWKFMGAGARSQIEYALAPYGPGKTLVTVIDRGEHSEAGVLEMCEGWDDFLSRLESRVRTGKNGRYRWTESIGCSAIVPMSEASARELMTTPEVWKAFGDTHVTLRREGDALLATMVNPAKTLVSTTARLTFRPHRSGTCMAVSHTGFALLPHEVQLAERRQRAGQWASLLAQLESRGYAVAAQS